MPKATPKTIGPNLDFMADGTEIPRGNVTWPRTHGQGPQRTFSDSALSQPATAASPREEGGGGCLACGVFISSGSPAWPTLEGTKTYLMDWGREEREFFCFVFLGSVFF